MPVIDFDAHSEPTPHRLDDFPPVEGAPAGEPFDGRYALSNFRTLGSQPSFPSPPPNASEQGDTHD
jgi:hypothetical protein